MILNDVLKMVLFLLFMPFVFIVLLLSAIFAIINDLHKNQFNNW